MHFAAAMLGITSRPKTLRISHLSHEHIHRLALEYELATCAEIAKAANETSYLVSHILGRPINVDIEERKQRGDTFDSEQYVRIMRKRLAAWNTAAARAVGTP